MSYISVKNLSFAYDAGDSACEKKVINNLSFDIEKGSFVCVLGHNGSGKSTLAKLLNLILTPTSGSVIIDGLEIMGDDFTDDDVFAVRRKVGMVFQDPDDQLVTTVVEEDVAFGPENLGLEPFEIRRRVENALKTVGMTEYAKHETHQLSGGQKQRIAIAGVIAMEPECIIFDESTAMLDPLGRKSIMDTIEYLNHEKGITVIHITHNMDEAVRADRVMIIDDGELYLDGTPSYVFSHVSELEKVGLDVPQVAELFYNLKQLGLKLPDDIVDQEKGAEVLASLLGNG